MGIVINIDPVIFSFGAFALRWYSLAIILAVIAAVLVAAHQGKKRGIPEDEIYSLLPWVLFAGLVGARLFHVMDYLDYYASNPAQILHFEKGGLAIWGALAGGGIATVAYAGLRHISLWRLVDTVTLGLLAAQIIGRFGCIVNGDAYGGITNLPWAFIYVHPNAMIPASLFGVPTHPYPVYEILWNGITLFIVLWLGRNFKRDGMLFLSYLSLYSLGRFLLTFVREEKVWFWGLQEAQVIALFALVASLVTLVYWLSQRQLRGKLTQS